MEQTPDLLHKTPKPRYRKENVKTAVHMAWPAIVESFFVAFAGLVDSLMVSSLGAYAVATGGTYNTA